MTTASPPQPDTALPVLESPFVDLIGAELIHARDGASEVRLDLETKHHNTWGVAHGGIVMTLADVALAQAARSLTDDGIGVVTVELKVNFMQPGKGVLHAYGRVMHRSTTMAFCEGEVRDADGTFVAKALGTFKYVKRLAVGRDVARQRMRTDANAQPGPSDD